MYPNSKPSGGGLAWRMFNGKWQFWKELFLYDHWVDVEDSPQERFNDIIVSYEDTWCEPFEGMEDEEKNNS